VDEVRIAPAGDGIHAAAEERTQDRLLEAAEAALRLLDRIDQHAPEGLAFGGEGRVRKQLRTAIRRSRLEADTLAWADAADPDEAEALDDLRTLTGRTPTERERAGFLAGFRERRAEMRG
jgi:hypothetical protein